jgi:hypothetical protein
VVRLSITVPVFFLVISVIPVFADTGSVTVVSGKTYNVDYISTGVQITEAQVDKSLGELLFTIQVLQNDATLQITLPRELIDSKNSNGTDSDFLVVVDGVLTKAQETVTPTTRTLQFAHLTTDEKEIDVIGTYLASSTTVAPSTPSTSSPTPPAQNQITTIPTPSPTQNVQQPPASTPSPTTPLITNVTQGKTFIQQTINNIISKIPYLTTFVNSMSIIDYAVIGSIALVIVIVIASVARNKSNKLSHKK